MRNPLPARSRATSNPMVALGQMALALLMSPMGVWAQTAGVAPDLQDWRAANEAVAQFKRGHIDLLKWERSNLPKAAPAAKAAADLTLMVPGDAVRAAWLRHPDLVGVQDRLGAEVSLQIAEGQLGAVDASLQRRVEGMGELLEVAADARKAWITAVAARKSLRFRQAALTSAEAGDELGRRMVRVGNWSPLQATPLQLATATARMDLRRAQVAAQQAESALLRLLGLGGMPMVLGLPDALPELPKAALTRDEWGKRLQVLQAQLPRANALHNRMTSQTAFEVYSASFELASTLSGEVLPLRRFITEETLLHYNGMLKSVWDLLGEVRSQAVAEVEGIAAQRDFWLAEADLQWTLLGGAPSNVVALGGGNADAAGPAAH